MIRHTRKYLSPGYPVLLLLIVALIGMGAIVYSTSLGVGLSVDSASYIATARNVAAGRGYVIVAADGSAQPVIHFPPFFAVVLALFQSFGLDAEVAARWLNAFLMFANTFSVSLVIFMCSRRSFGFALAGALLFISSESILTIHAMAWSEPLFITLAIIGLTGLGAYFVRHNRSVLLVSSLAIGLACLTRYVGVTLILTGLLALLLSDHTRLWRRFLDGAVFAVTCCLPIGVWLIGNALAGGPTTVREFRSHPITGEKLQRGWDTLRFWLLPDTVPDVVRDVVLLGLLALIIFAAVKSRRSEDSPVWCSRFVLLSSLFVAVYTILLIISMSFFDSRTRLDYRILSPAYVMGLPVVLHLLARVTVSIDAVRPAKFVFVVLGIVLVGINLWRGAAWTLNSHNAGLGYANQAWRQSALIREVQAVSTDVELYSNECEAIYLLARRPCSNSPDTAAAVGLPNTQEPPGLSVDETRYFAWFTQSYRGDLSEMASVFDLKEIAVASDGSLYALLPRASLKSLPLNASTIDAVNENGLGLAGYELSAVGYDEERHRQIIEPTLYWQIQDSCRIASQAAIKLVNAAKTVWAAEQVYTPCRHWRDGVLVADTVRLEVYPGTPPGSYDIEVILLRLQDGRQMPPVNGPEVVIGPVEIPFDSKLTREFLDVQHQVDAQLANSVRLIGYNMAGGTNRGEMFSFTAFWECLSDMEEDFTVFFHVGCRPGRSIACAER